MESNLNNPASPSNCQPSDSEKEAPKQPADADSIVTLTRAELKELIDEAADKAGERYGWTIYTDGPDIGAIFWPSVFIGLIGAFIFTPGLLSLVSLVIWQENYSAFWWVYAIQATCFTVLSIIFIVYLDRQDEKRKASAEE